MVKGPARLPGRRRRGDPGRRQLSQRRQLRARLPPRRAASRCRRRSPRRSPHLLEPMHKLTVVCPSSATSRITSAVAGRRGQMLGMAPRDGWTGWDRIEALIPEAELSGPRGGAALAEPGPCDLRGGVRPSGRAQRAAGRQGHPATGARTRLRPQFAALTANAGSPRRGARNEALVQGPAFPVAAEEQQLSRAFARRSRRLLASRRSPSPAAGSACAVRHADPHHQLRQGGQRAQQVPVVAADRPLRRPGAGRRRPRGLQGVDRLRLRPRRGQRHRRDDRRRRACCRSSAAGSGSPTSISGWRCSTARCCRPWARRRPSACFARSTASTSSAGRAQLPRSPARSWPASPSRTARRSKPMSRIWFVTDLGGDLYCGSSPGASCGGAACSKASARRCEPTTLPGAWRFAIHVNLTSSLDDGLGADRAARRRRPARPRRRRALPRRVQPCRQRAEARRPARQGLLSRSRPDGPRDQASVEADASRRGAWPARSASLAVLAAARRRQAAGRASVRQGVPRRLSDPAGADHRAVARRSSASRCRRCSMRSTGPDAPLKARLVGTIVYLRHRRAALLALRRDRRGDRVRPRQCVDGR